MFTSRRILSLFVLTAAVIGLVAAPAVAQDLELIDCSAGTDIFGASVDCANATGGSTSYGIIAAPSVYNPVTTQDTASDDIQDPTVDGGFNNLANGAAGTIPAVASVIEISEDGASITYTVRDGLQYSDGSSVAISDILYWYEDVVLNPNLPNSSVDASACPDGSTFAYEQLTDNQLSISCADTFRTFSGNAGAAFVLSQQMAEDLIESQGIATEAGVVGPRATAEFMGLGIDLSLVRGLGPFVIDSLDSQALATYSRNPLHYQVDSNGTRLPYLDNLEILLIPTQGQNLNLSNFLAGQTDVLGPRPSDIGPILGAAAGGSIVVNSDIDNGTAAGGTTFVTLNYDDQSEGLSAAARNANVRHALSLAVDRVAAVNNVLLGIGSPQYLPFTLSGAPLTTFFIGRNNTCATFADLGMPCDDATGLLTARSGLQLNVQQIPPTGLSANMDQHLSCLPEGGLASCLEIANGILDSEGLTDTDGDGIRNLSDGSNWQVQVVTNSGNTIREGYTQIICDGWTNLGIECSATSTSFGTLVTQLLGLGGATWTGGIVIGLTGGDPAGGSNVYRCGAALYFWHLSCDPDATSGPSAQLPEDVVMQAGFDQGFNATSVADAQAGFDEWQRAWTETTSIIHTAIPNALFAVRTDRLCNDGRTDDGNVDVKFRVDVPGNENACATNVGR